MPGVSGALMTAVSLIVFEQKCSNYMECIEQKAAVALAVYKSCCREKTLGKKMDGEEPDKNDVCCSSVNTIS